MNKGATWIKLKRVELVCLIISALFPLFTAWHRFGFSLQNLRLPLTFNSDELLYEVNTLSFYHWTPLINHNLGAPFGQNLNYAFMSVDSGPILLAGLLAHLGGGVFFGINAMYLLSFSLAGISGYLAARVLNVGPYLSLIAGLIISLPPFHLLWWTSGITVTSYFILPLLFALTIRQMEGNLEKRGFIILVGLAILNGIWYSYYALGYMFLIGTYLFFKSLIDKNLDSVKKVILPILAGNLSFFLVSIPALLARHSAKGVDYFGQRDAWAGIVSSTTLLHFVTPYPNSFEDWFHRVLGGSSPNQSVVHFQQLMNGTGLFAEGWTGAIPWGLLFVSVAVSVKSLRKPDLSKKATEEFIKSASRIRTLQSLVVVALLWSVVGGFDTIFSIAILSILRGFARYSILVIICMVLLAVVGLQTFDVRTRKISVLWIILSLVPIGLFFNNAPLRAGTTKAIVEATLGVENSLSAPKDCAILQLPIMHYPYEPPGYPTYRLLRFALISDRYKWSSGAVGGSPGYNKLLPLKEAQKISLKKIEVIAKSFGYCGILIDKEAWQSVAQFHPWPTYDNGLIPYDTLIASGNISLTQKLIPTAFGDYIWIPTP